MLRGSWQARLAPFAAAKDVVAYVLCPEDLMAAGARLQRTLSTLYAACRLGSHALAEDGVIPYASGSGRSGLRGAAERLQKRLLLHPPPVRCLLAPVRPDTTAAVLSSRVRCNAAAHVWSVVLS